MIEMFGNIDWLGVMAATVAASILGGVWFVALFSKAYATALGRESEPPQKMAPIFVVGPFFCAFVTVIASAMLMQALHITSTGEAMQFAVVVGLGYLAATTVNTGINPNIPRPLLYGLISGGYFFLSSIVISLVLVSVR